MDGAVRGDPYSKTSPFLSKDLPMQNITSNQSLASGSDAAAYRSHQNVGLPSIHRVAAGAASNMAEIREEGTPYDAVAAYHDMSQDYLAQVDISGSPVDQKGLPKIKRALEKMNYKDLVLSMN